MAEIQCPNEADFRYTWPGRDESWICVEHAPKLAGIASAMGLHLQLLPLADVDRAQRQCAQMVKAATKA